MQPGRSPSPSEKLTSYFAMILQMSSKQLVEEILFVVVGHPLRQNGASAADDPGDALGHHRQVLHQQAGMDGHVVHALRGLLFDDFQHQLRPSGLRCACTRATAS